MAVACVLLLAGTWAMRPSGAPVSSSGYRIGETLDLPATWYADTKMRPTVLLFVRHDCAVCQGAAPVIQELRAALDARGIRVALVAPGDDSAAEMEFAGRLGFQASRTYAADLRGVRLSTVPSVVVADAAGTVLYERLIPTDKEEGQDVLAAILETAAGV